MSSEKPALSLSPTLFTRWRVQGLPVLLWLNQSFPLHSPSVPCFVPSFLWTLNICDEWGWVSRVLFKLQPAHRSLCHATSSHFDDIMWSFSPPSLNVILNSCSPLIFSLHLQSLSIYVKTQGNESSQKHTFLLGKLYSWSGSARSSEWDFLPFF